MPLGRLIVFSQLPGEPLRKKRPASCRVSRTKRAGSGAWWTGPVDADENARLSADWMLACKREWADRVDKKGEWLYSEAYRNFLIDLLNQRLGEVVARLLVVTLDGMAVAAIVLGLGESRKGSVIGSFDPKHSRFAPGSSAPWRHVLNGYWIKGSISTWASGQKTYKGYWSRDNFTAVWSMQIANTHWGPLAFAGDKLRQTLSQRVAKSRTILQPE